MNKKGQFFIVSTVVMAIALTIMLTLLTIPFELTTTNLISQSRDVHQLQETISNFKTITNALYGEWPVEQSTRTSFTIKNYNQFNANNNEFIIRLDIDDFAIDNSFELIREGEIMPASFSQISNGTILIGFTDTLDIGETKDYNLYYNVQSDNIKALVEQEKITRITESGSEITYSSPVYEVTINKATGIINELKVIGNINDLSTSFGARVNTNSQSSMTATTSLMSYENNILIVNASGQIDPNVYLMQYYYLHPSFISVKQEFNIKSSGTYNLSYVADVTSIIDSLAYDIYDNSSLTVGLETSFNAKNHHTIFKDDTGIGFYYHQPSVSTVQTSSGVDTRIQLLENNYNINIITQELIINPYFNEFNNSIICGNNYNNNPRSYELMKNNEFNFYLTYPLTNSLTSSSTNLEFEKRHESLTNPRTIISYNQNPSSTPFNVIFNTEVNQDLNTLEIRNNNNELLSHGLSTLNYHNTSYTNFILINDASEGVTSTNYSLMNLLGNDFSINVIMNSDSLPDTLDARVYSANNTLIHEETLSASVAGVYETKHLDLISYNVSGIYTLELEGDNVKFYVLTSLPLISANSPIIVENSETLELYYETNKNHYLNFKGLKATTADVIVNNTNGIILSDTVDINKELNHSYYSTTSYNIILSAGTTLVNTSTLIGTKDYYLNNINYVINYPNFGKNYLIFNTTSSTVNNTVYYENMTYDFATHKFTNKDYSWDFDNELFYYGNLNNWLYSGDFYACTGTYASCSIESNNFSYESLIENTTLFKTAYFTSTSINPIIRMYNASNLFEITLINPTSDEFTFGLNYRIDGDDDSFYKTSFSTAASLTSEQLFSSTELNQGFNYFGKRDGNTYTGFIINSADILQGQDSVRISDDYIRFSLNGFKNHKVYFFITSDWSELERITNSLNNIPTIYTEPIQYYYTYSSNNVDSSGTIIG